MIASCTMTFLQHSLTSDCVWPTSSKQSWRLYVFGRLEIEWPADVLLHGRPRIVVAKLVRPEVKGPYKRAINRALLAVRQPRSLLPTCWCEIWCSNWSILQRILRFRMGSHLLPIEQGCHLCPPRHRHVCRLCHTGLWAMRAGFDRASSSQQVACCQDQLWSRCSLLHIWLISKYRAGSLLPTAIHEQAAKCQSFKICLKI